MYGVACNNEEKVKVTAAFQTQSGKPARIDGEIRVTPTSGEGTVEMDPSDPNSFFLVSSDTPGTTEYLVEVDVDLGDGQEFLTESITLEVSGAKAASFGFTHQVLPKTA